MQRALSTHLFANHRLTTVWLERIGRAEIPLVEIFCARQHLDYRNRAQVAELGYWFRDSTLKLHSLHSPMYTDEIWGRSGPDAVIDITAPVKSVRMQAVDEIKRAIEIAETVPFRYLIQHLGVRDQEFTERAVDAAFSSLEELSLFARQRGVEVLLENIPNALSSAERLLMFLDTTHLNLNICFDTGHAHMNEGVENAYRLLKSRIRSTHVHDNDGKEDLHLFPLAKAGEATFTGAATVGPPVNGGPSNGTTSNGHATIDWRRAMSELRSASNQYPLLLELKEVTGVEHPIDAARETFDRLESLPALDEVEA